jgi:UDP-N-acetylmuramate--alanine ligase
VDLQDGEKLGVTVSGGKDSTYMWGVLADLFGPDRILALTYYRPGITDETAVRNMKRTSEILKCELVIHTEEEAYDRFRKDLEMLLRKPEPEAVRVLLCAGCRYGITGTLYQKGRERGIRKFFSAASYLELAPFKEELLAARDPSGDIDAGLERVLADYPALSEGAGNTLEVILRDQRFKYKDNDTVKCRISVDPEIELFDFDDYFQNDPGRIEVAVRSRFDWQKTHRSWHFDCIIEEFKDLFYYGMLGYTELDFKTAAMVRYGLLTLPQAEEILQVQAEKIASSYDAMLEKIRSHGLGHLKAALDDLYIRSRYLDYPVDYHDYIGKRVHMIGIGGASMSGIASMLQRKGCIVSGSDMIDGETVRELREQGMKVTIGHSADNTTGADLVVYSMAIPEDQPELASCRERKIPTIERSVLLGQLSADHGRSVAVCGTHGKTTVTSMLAQILVETGADPTLHIGGVLDMIGGSTRVGGSDIFVTEACEYRRNFMNVHPNIAVLLNIDTDHLDYYRDIDEIESSFGDFLSRLPREGWALVNGDDERARRQSRRVNCEVSTFGVSEDCDYRMSEIREGVGGMVSFDLSCKGRSAGHVDMRIPGRFNAMNALAALAAADHLGVEMETACRIVSRFSGAHRRFELTGTLKGAEVFHDYGHNPTEMRNVISIARKRCREGRLWAVMQPHTYSRVKTMFGDYLHCTEEADISLVTDIFASRETDPGDIDAGMLVTAMQAEGIDARLTPSFADAEEMLKAQVRPGDLVITMGCGDVYKLNDMLKEETSEKESAV